MKRLLPTGLMALALVPALGGCAHGPRFHAPHLHAPHLHGPGHIQSPVVLNSSRYYEVNGHYYRRWREGWIAPAGYAERQWQVGETLAQVYLDGSFRIMWNSHKLPWPGEKRQWVRVGNDALLVADNGRIDMVIRRFFM